MSVGNLLKETTTVTAVDSAATVSGLPSAGSVGIQITGTMTGTTITFECTVDNVNWVPVSFSPANAGAGTTTATATGVWRQNVGGYTAVRARCSTFASVSPVLTVRYVGS